MVFEKTLTDIVKGIRASKRDTALYISSCIAEIKNEINSTDPHTKANALQKLTFLQMMGYNMSYASFATIEVMSNTRFAFKRIGYLAASQAFTQDTDVVLLTTNTLKKELRGAIGPGMNGVYEAGLAINCLSNIVTEDLARDLLSDVTNLIVHPQPYLRKKAILCLLKMFMKYPQGLRLTFSKLQDSLLKDINPSVTSCAVNVITELSDKNPKNYLVLAPSFFALLTTSSNNWMLIKVVKLLGSLVPEEPRLARKLLDPLANIVKNTQAKSLLYEAVYTITLCLPYCQKSDGSMPANVPSIVSLCAQTLKNFIQEQDQNLKYLGLVGFASLMVSHPKVLAGSEYRGLILACLSDDDVTIRTRGLDLLIGVATRKNVMELVTQLLHHVDNATGLYKVDLVVKIIEICCSDKYALLTDFAWYMDVLVILAHTKGIESIKSSTISPTIKPSGHLQQQQKQEVGPLISSQITDVTLRVLPVRAYSVRRMISVLLQDGKHANDNGHQNSMGTLGMTTTVNMMPEVLPAAAWIVGEYALLIDEAVSMTDENDDDDSYEEDELTKYDSTSVGTYHAIIQALTDSSNIDSAAAATQSIYVQAAMKVFAAATTSKACEDAELEACVARLGMYLPVFMHSMNAEVQERAFTAYQLLISLGLVLNPDAPPCMTLIKEDEGNDSDESEDKDVPQDDLLNLVMSAPNNATKASRSTSKSSQGFNDFSMSTAQKSRNVSETLKYIFIPEQMKPISAKAQRKKRQSAPAIIQEALDEPVNLSVFSSFLTGDRMRLDGKRSIEAVSFTQQKPMRKTKSESRQLHLNNMEGFGSGSIMSVPEAVPEKTHTDSLNHPFYLNANQHSVNDKDTNNRFGTIQLLDDEQDSDDSNAKKKKKGKRRKKKTSSKETNQRTTSNNLPVILIDSDEEEDDEPLVAMFHGKMKGPSKSHFEGFDSLAQIDLTTPLRDDETMPTMEHRVVPERKIEQEEKSIPRKDKKPKKEKKLKKSKGTSIPNTAVDAGISKAKSVDLLDFSSLSISAPTPNKSATTNPINNAFDDLLALDLPSAEPLQINALHPEESAITEKPKKLRPAKTSKVWQEATIKSSKASGKNTTFNWEDLKLLYRIKLNGDNAIFLSFKLVNNGDQSLHDIAINFKEGNQNVGLDNIESHGLVESSRIGPFPLDLNSFNTELKGSLVIAGAGCTAPIKISIATCTLSLVPINGLTQDAVGELLSSCNWSSSSAKIQYSKTLSVEKMKSILKSFLQAEEVFTGSDGLNGIFASQTPNGSKVLTLLKSSGDSTIKIDVKSTDKDLSKAVSSAIKRVML